MGVSEGRRPSCFPRRPFPRGPALIVVSIAGRSVTDSNGNYPGASAGTSESTNIRNDTGGATTAATMPRARPAYPQLLLITQIPVCKASLRRDDRNRVVVQRRMGVVAGSCPLIAVSAGSNGGRCFAVSGSRRITIASSLTFSMQLTIEDALWQKTTSTPWCMRAAHILVDALRSPKYNTQTVASGRPTASNRCVTSWADVVPARARSARSKRARLT